MIPPGIKDGRNQPRYYKSRIEDIKIVLDRHLTDIGLDDYNQIIKRLKELGNECNGMKASLASMVGKTSLMKGIIHGYQHNLKFIIKRLDFMVEHPYAEHMDEMGELK